MRPTPIYATALFTLIACGSGPAVRVAGDWPLALHTAPVRAAHGMVVSTDDYASRVGDAVLRAGGNAVDAAVATAFALAVVNPEAGNLGGGGFLLTRLASGEAAALDFRERAPAAAHRDMYLDADGELTDDRLLGHRAAGVPGTVAGLWAAHQRFGQRPWPPLVEPAIELARGFVVRPRQAHSLAHAADALRRFASTAAAFLPKGEPPRAGETLAQPDLVRTLERIRDHGPDGFYRGATAAAIVAEMQRGGGLITADDLAQYQPVWRTPIAFDYRGHRVLSMPPPSSGGATLAAMAHILAGFELGALPWHGTLHTHLLAEAWKRAYADRNTYLADPDHVEMPLHEMTSTGYGAARRGSISLQHATPASEVKPGLGPIAESSETTHLSVVDRDGNAVALTTTINSFYGCKVTVAGAGFLLNNEMDDFATKPGSANQFGLVQGENNAIAPGKRMLSAMTPTIVARPDGSLLYVTGTPGGSTIITNVFQNLSNVIDFGMGVVAATHAPRLHHQHLPDVISCEPGALTDATISALRAMGHAVEERFDESAAYPYIGDIQAIFVNTDGSLEACSDPRRGGRAVGH